MTSALIFLSCTLLVVYFTAQSLLVVYLTAQSCRNKDSELNDLVTDHDIDMMLLTENWLKEQGDEAQKAEMMLAGYVLKSFPRKDRR